jgi:hypothetical protein
MNLTTLSDDLLALVILKLDRYSLSALILSCKIIYNRSLNQDLLLIVASKKGILVPSPMLVVHDYGLVSPREFIPVFIRGTEIIMRFDINLGYTIAKYFPRHTCVLIKFEIVSKQQTKYVQCQCIKTSEKSLLLIQTHCLVKFTITDPSSNKNTINVNHNGVNSNMCDWLNSIIKEHYYIVSISADKFTVPN